MGEGGMCVCQRKREQGWEKGKCKEAMCVRLTLPQVRYCDLQHIHIGTKKRIDAKNKAVRIETENP